MLVLISCIVATQVSGQRLTINQMKAKLEQAVNPIAYARDSLKKKYSLDTVVIRNANYFLGLADSLAYKGKPGKVYGPFEGKYLVQVMAKAPNEFYRISQVFLDTAVLAPRVADSLANSIIDRIRSGSATMADMAMTYSMGGEGKTKGDLGWMARGSIQPEIEKKILRCSKGEVFKTWSRTGLHIIQLTGMPKQDNGFALLMRVFL